ncbi:MAG: alpha/beta hydrolase [Proteobacteria bacterium]|nr:alpha/beta hydrolase [Pseudomonadota bacterium]
MNIHISLVSSFRFFCMVWLCCYLSACAASRHHDQIHTLSTTPTSSSSLTIYTLENAVDHVSIRYGVYTPSLQSLPQEKFVYDKVLLFVLGKGEWVEKYLSVYKVLTDHLNYPVVIVDHPGQGGSGGERGHIDSYDDYTAATVAVINDHFPRASYSVIAHSMGGLIALYGTMKQHLRPQKLILSSPLLALRKKPVHPFVARPLSKSLSWLGFDTLRTPVSSESSYSFEENRLTTDRDKFLASKDLPYTIPSPSMGWVNATFNASDFIHSSAHLKELSTDTLVFLAEHEVVVSASAIPAWVEKAQQHSDASIELMFFEDAKHELFNEKDATTNKALQAVFAFLGN